MLSVQASLGNFLNEEFVVRSDILERIKENKEAWKNFEAFSPEYKRIRIAFIEGTRKRSEEFKKRLKYFIEMTEKNKHFEFGCIKNIVRII